VSFTKEVKSFALGFQKGSEKAIRGTTIKLWEAVILSSPVDEGRFRANWFASMNGVTTTTKNTDRNTATAAKAAQAVLSQADFSRFTLSNNLPYALRLEYGYSDQAPAGVVRTNVKRFNRLLAAEAKKSLPK
jgi:hypothetical protein